MPMLALVMSAASTTTFSGGMLGVNARVTVTAVTNGLDADVVLTGIPFYPRIAGKGKMRRRIVTVNEELGAFLAKLHVTILDIELRDDESEIELLVNLPVIQNQKIVLKRC